MSGGFHSGYGRTLHCWIKDGNCFCNFLSFQKTFEFYLNGCRFCFIIFFKLVDQTLLLLLFLKFKMLLFSKLTNVWNQYKSVNKMTWWWTCTNLTIGKALICGKINTFSHAWHYCFLPGGTTLYIYLFFLRSNADFQFGNVSFLHLWTACWRSGLSVSDYLLCGQVFASTR